MFEPKPRVYSLSTLNLRQHFNCDYKFHEFRTDFSGESGSGKSLIADFIQLLLVGSGTFRSGTEGVGSRDVSGLALPGSGNKYGRGYLLMNILLSPGKYLCIGGYLESSSSQMTFFVISANYDFDQPLTHLDRPIFYRDLLREGRIEPADQLLKQRLEKGYLRTLTTKRYHQLLYDNGILAVDLSQNKQSLRSFAAIIRSFSRGKGYFANSDALKTFLFGDDDHRRLVERYKDEVQQISLDLANHHRLVEEVELIKGKEQKLETVLQRYRSYQTVKLAFSRDNANFWLGRFKHTEGNALQAEQKLQLSAMERALIRQRILEQQLDDIRYQAEQWTKVRRSAIVSRPDKLEKAERLKLAKATLTQLTPVKALIDKATGWFTKYDSEEEVRAWHERERRKMYDHAALKELTNVLEREGLITAFERSAWYHSGAEGSEIDALRAELEQINVQLTFTDLNDPGSLARWALDHLQLPLSLEQESLLIHYQHLERQPPEIPAGEYLAEPSSLFPKPVTKPAGLEGFWIDRCGIYEYVAYVKTRFLHVPVDAVRLPEGTRPALQKRADELSGFRAASVKLKEVLRRVQGLERAVALYREGANVLTETHEEIGELTNSALQEHLQAYAERTAHLARYEVADLAHEQAYDDHKESERQDDLHLKQQKNISSHLIQQYGSSDTDQLSREKQEELRTWEGQLAELDGGQLKSTTERLFSTRPAMSKLYEMREAADKSYYVADEALTQARIYLQQAGLKKNDALVRFMQDHQREHDPVNDLQAVAEQPDEQTSFQARNDFDTAFALASEGIEDQDILKDRDIGILAHKLLPTVFPSHRINEALIGEKIDQRLHELTDALRSIGARKVEILHHIFNEVQQTYNEYLAKTALIGRYLSSKDRQITGGNRATLQHRPVPGYPDGWFKTFRNRLSSELQNTGLFSGHNRQDIDQIMVTVFREAGGDKTATYEDLLDPRSYFDLIFDIQLDDGRSNAGSNGQTYTANALLCLARLSLIADESRRGIRVMPVDEAEGLGSNFTMLHTLAQKEGYQLITMSIETAGEEPGSGQYVYIMHDNKHANSETYVPPLGIFNNAPITPHIHEIFNED